MRGAGRHVIVTGASSGYGAAIAARFADDGWTVHAVCRSSPGERVRWHEVDLLMPDETLSVVSTLRSDGIVVDGVVHCAVTRERVPFDHTTVIDLSNALTVAVLSPLMLVKYLWDFGVYDRERGLCVFPCDTRWSVDALAFSTAKVAVQPIAQRFAGEFPSPGLHIEYSVFSLSRSRNEAAVVPERVVGMFYAKENL
jgi:NAD(P)-dependent dehydrogenase (short-subunit alcohol dehydrogenase family)